MNVGNNGESKEWGSGPRRIIASSVGSILTSLVMTPLDVIKIRIQSASLPGNCSLYCNCVMDYLCACDNGVSLPHSRTNIWYGQRRNFKSSWVRAQACFNPEGIHYCIFHSGLRKLCSPALICSPRSNMSSAEALSTIVRTEGILSLWSGLSPALVMALPQTIVYFSMNDWLKDYISFKYTSHRYQETNAALFIDFIPPVVGAISRIFSVFTISPLELMRTKLQSKPMSFKSFTEIAKSAVAQDGVRSLWTGMGPTLLRDVPFSAIFWYVYDFNKSRYLRTRTCISSYTNVSSAHDFPVFFLFGAMAGFTAGFFTHPFDVIKTHRQLELGESFFASKLFKAIALLM
ncbi:unnamed protein product [Mesocestoides corti]|uniref:Solute carrier family 25 member 40 n=1 Tax=Mesocestoides corti TaxID=53468 RepID=A0A0R3UI71_MESCO|nr:unnamed protein product [Mesocestoides corti]